jgi:folate-binding protein YgfZ
MTPQYRTIATGAGWLDVSARGRLRFDGPDAASFLHALVTNDVASLAVGRGVYAALLTPQGRMVTDMRLLRAADGVLAEVPAGLASSLAVRFDHLIFSEKVAVVDDSGDTRALCVFGGRAAQVVSDATGIPAARIAELSILDHVAHDGLTVIRTDDVTLPNFEIWMPTLRWESTVAAVIAAGAVETTLFDALRIEAGHPLFGVDMTTETIPLEAGLHDRAISTAKGCYVGQEVIIRIMHRGGGRVAKHLVQLLADPDVAEIPDAGTPVFDQGREVGAVTSAALGPAAGRVVALAYVHRDSAEGGRHVTVGSALSRWTVQREPAHPPPTANPA